MIIIPQITSRSHLWMPTLSDNKNLIDNIFKLCENNLMTAKKTTFYYEDYKQITLEEFSSLTGTSPNLVFKGVHGPKVYYKKDGFSCEEFEFIKKLLLKVKGKRSIQFL